MKLILCIKPRAVAAITAATALGLIYYYFDPVEMGQWFPTCPVHQLTGLSCPSCGNQRALHALLEGELREAIHYNYFLLFCVVYFIGTAIGFTIKSPLNSIRCFFTGKKGACLYICAYLIWFIIRNAYNL